MSNSAYSKILQSIILIYTLFLFQKLQIPITSDLPYYSPSEIIFQKYIKNLNCYYLSSPLSGIFPEQLDNFLNILAIFQKKFSPAIFVYDKVFSDNFLPLGLDFYYYDNYLAIFMQKNYNITLMKIDRARYSQESFNFCTEISWNSNTPIQFYELLAEIPVEKVAISKQKIKNQLTEKEISFDFDYFSLEINRNATFSSQILTILAYFNLPKNKKMLIPNFSSGNKQFNFSDIYNINHFQKEIYRIYKKLIVFSIDEKEKVYNIWGDYLFKIIYYNYIHYKNKKSLIYTEALFLNSLKLNEVYQETINEYVETLPEYICLHPRVEKDMGKFYSRMPSLFEILNGLKDVEIFKNVHYIYICIGKNIQEIDGFMIHDNFFMKKHFNIELVAKPIQTGDEFVDIAIDFEMCKHAKWFLGNPMSLFSRNINKLRNFKGEGLKICPKINERTYFSVFNYEEYTPDLNSINC